MKVQTHRNTQRQAGVQQVQKRGTVNAGERKDGKLLKVITHFRNQRREEVYVTDQVMEYDIMYNAIHR